MSKADIQHLPSFPGFANETMNGTGGKGGSGINELIGTPPPSGGASTFLIPSAKSEPPSSALPPAAEEDAGVIRCICGYDQDDGFTILCESCNIWQHADCVGITDGNVPDVYLCDLCSPRNMDIPRAKALQKSKLEALTAPPPPPPAPTSQSSSSPPIPPQQNRKRSKSKPASSTTTSKQNDKHNHRSKPSTDANNVNINTNSNNTRKQRARSAMSQRDDTPAPESEESAKPRYLAEFVHIPECRYLSPDIEKESLAILPKNDVNDNDQDQHVPCSVRQISEHSRGHHKFTGHCRYGLFVDTNVPKDKALIEYVGEVGFVKDYQTHPINQYGLFGCAKPHVIIHSSLYIDARRCGNETRFLRRSCKPNVELGVVKNQPAGTKFVLVSTQPIKAGTELTAPWEFDATHPVHRLIAGDELNNEDKLILTQTGERILQTCGECACGKSSDCLITQMKRANNHHNHPNNNNHTGGGGGDEVLPLSANFPLPSAVGGDFMSSREERKVRAQLALFDSLEKGTTTVSAGSIKKRKRSPTSISASPPPAGSTTTNNNNNSQDTIIIAPYKTLHELNLEKLPAKARVCTFYLRERAEWLGSQSNLAATTGDEIKVEAFLPSAPSPPPPQQQQQQVQGDVAIEERPAKPVKKLSLADYKRKQTSK